MRTENWPWDLKNRKSSISAISQVWLSLVCVLEWMWIEDRSQNVVDLMVAPRICPHGDAQKLKDAKNRFSPGAFTRSMSLLTPDVWLLSSRTMRKLASLLLAMRFVFTCYSCHGKLIQRTFRSKGGVKNGERKFWQMVTNSNVLRGQVGKRLKTTVEVVKTGAWEMLCTVYWINIQIIFPHIPHTYRSCCPYLLQSLLPYVHVLQRI